MVKTLANFQSDKRVRILQYGETGTGKSIRAASAARWGDVYFFDFDGKIGSVYEYYKDEPEILARISYDTYIDTRPSEPNACLAAYEKLNEIWTQCENGEIPYSTVVWDSWTSFEAITLNQVMASNPNFNRMQVKIAGETTTVPDRADYRIHAHSQWTLIPKLTALPMNLIVISHVSIRQDELSGRIERGLAAAGKLSKVLPKYFAEVHRTMVPEGEFKCQIKSDMDWTCNTTLKDIPKDGVVTADLSLFDDHAFRKEKK